VCSEVAVAVCKGESGVGGERLEDPGGVEALS